MRHESPPTETSPLLATQAVNPDSAANNVSAINHEVPHNERGVSPSPGDAEANGDGDEEDLNGASTPPQKAYQGIPEVRKKLHIILPAMAIGVFLSALDQTIIVAAYGTIGSDLHALNKTSWIATAYFLTLTSFQPLFGRLSDTFGRKPCLIFGYIVFGLGCLGCGLARNINQLIAARAFAGIGGGSMTTTVSIILSDVVTIRERGQWNGYLNIIYGIGAASGAPLGGFLAEISWRWSFLAQAPMCLVASILVYFILHLPKRDSLDWRTKLKRVDFLGAITMVAAVFFLVLGLDRGSNQGWDEITIISLCVSIPLFAIFIFIEVKVAVDPFAPGHIIFKRSVIPCNLCNFFSFAGWLSAIFYLPLYFQAVGRRDPAHAGLLMLPGVLGATVGSISAGVYMQKTGRNDHHPPVFGNFDIVNSWNDRGHGHQWIVKRLWDYNQLDFLIHNVAPADQAVATACFYLFRQLGTVTGLAVSATVTNQLLRSKLSDALSNSENPDQIAEGVRQSLSYIKTLTPEVQEIVRDCYSRSVRGAFGAETIMVVGAGLSAIFLKEKLLSR